ncbi:hypothetical protein [Chroococcidiopsis thermalis]|uniref:Uncharacterized protein n=1 Tax=Chroococcidiopsis thermalis (strain PCC 7203) TaxID=251229 RepID=K9TYA0_CHRTP|nr:hypothetical protein [Chroococcidiopsis thermalis]AFY87782.1 hypothetical protein Chro_2290 [Chroococcidiopsis thermalis PCC 7203]
MITSPRQNLTRFPGTPIAIILSAIAISALQLPQLNKLTSKAQNNSVAQLNQELEVEKQRLQVLRKLPSFGFNNLVSNWTFINFLIYFGDDTVRDKTGYSLSPEFFEVVINRDPYFLHAYPFLSGSTTMYAGMPERTIALMEKGLKHMSAQFPPKSYYVWRYKGMNELLFTDNATSAKKSFEIAANWASHYSDEESKSVLAISRQTAKFLETNPLSKSAKVSAWVMVFNNAIDDRTRKLAISKIQALGGRVTVTPQGGLSVQLPQKD